MSIRLNLFLVLALAQASDPPPPPDAAPSLLDGIDQRGRIVERKLELLEEQAAAARTTAPVVTAGDRGFHLKSADGAFVVKIRGLVHVDGRQYLDDDLLELRDTFLIRRARPLLEATLWDLADVRLMPDFGGGTAVVQDAYVDLRPFAWLKLRAGKFKPPVGLERLQSASAIAFVERGFPTSLAPNRDVGVQLYGAVLGGALETEIVPLLIVIKLEQYQYSEATALALVMLIGSFATLMIVNALQARTRRGYKHG